MTGPGSYSTDASVMFAIHHAILGALADAPGLVDGASTDAGRVETVASYYENVLEFLHVHHGGEDAILYPLLEERCADQRAELARIDDQHKTLYGPMDDGRAAIDAWRAAPTPEGSVALVEALANVDTVLRPHLADEEEHVVPLIPAWISPEEWGSLAMHSMQSFAKDRPYVMMGLILEQMNDDQRAALISGMPPPVQTMWTTQMAPAFDAFISEVRA